LHPRGRQPRPRRPRKPRNGLRRRRPSHAPNHQPSEPMPRSRARTTRPCDSVRLGSALPFAPTHSGTLRDALVADPAEKRRRSRFRIRAGSLASRAGRSHRATAGVQAVRQAATLVWIFEWPPGFIRRRGIGAPVRIAYTLADKSYYLHGSVIASWPEPPDDLRLF
jgi:hypothetical protein